MEYLEGKPLLNQKKRVVLANEVLTKTSTIIFFFSASYCPQCLDLNEKLEEIYEEANNRELDIEIINVPCDRTMHDFMQQFSTQGNWYSLIFGDTLAQELAWIFSVTYLPNLIVVTREGQIVTKNGYNELMQIGKNVLVTWTQ